MTTGKEYHDQILAKASEDDDFRASLLEDPVAAVSSELNVDLPDELTINVHEDGQNVVNLVLPPKKRLAEDELAQVAGGQLLDDGQW